MILNIKFRALMEQFHSCNDNNILNCVITVPEVNDLVK